VHGLALTVENLHYFADMVSRAEGAARFHHITGQRVRPQSGHCSYSKFPKTDNKFHQLALDHSAVSIQALPTL